MKRISTTTALAIFALAIASAVSSSHAATISWGSVQDSVTETDVIATGTLSVARNFGSTGAVSTTAA